MKHIFTAIDFETANRWHGSACAVGAVRVEDGVITELKEFFIDPRIDAKYWNRAFSNDCHGITIEDVKGATDFGRVWRKLQPMFEGAEFIAAHNAFRFDKRVLQECCRRYHIEPPAQWFVCSIQAARACWKLDSYSLDNVCGHLGIELDHHNALSDALGCAKIMAAAFKKGFSVQPESVCSVEQR
jgi:DNA polymerase III subunit epsilon